jgi:hypothetical protein
MMLSQNLKQHIVCNMNELFLKTYVETDSILAKKQYRNMAQGLIVGSPLWEIDEIRDLAIENAKEVMPENFVGILEEIWEEIF